jgi:hypothetical protein
MDPLRYNCTLLYERPYICRDIVGFGTTLISPLSATLSFPTDPDLSQHCSRREETVDVGPLNHYIGLEEDRWKAKGVW